MPQKYVENCGLNNDLEKKEKIETYNTIIFFIYNLTYS